MTNTNFQNAINSAAPGDTLLVPAGTFDRSGSLSILGISLIDAGNSVPGTVITAGTVTMTKHASFHPRLSGFRFTCTVRHLMVQGSGKASIIDNNSSAGMCGGSAVLK